MDVVEDKKSADTRNNPIDGPDTKMTTTKDINTDISFDSESSEDVGKVAVNKKDIEMTGNKGTESDIAINNEKLRDETANLVNGGPDIELTNFSDSKDKMDDAKVVIDDSDLLKVNEAPDGGWGWFVVLGACFVHLLMGGFERSNGIMYLQLLDYYGKSATETAWVLSIFSTLRLFAGPLASAFVNRFSCRIVCFMGSFLCTLGLFLSTFAPNLYYLYFSYGLLGGLGRSFCYTPSLIIVGYYFNKRRGLAVGLATSGVGFGTFLFPPMIEILFDTYGHSGTFLILAGVISHFFICACLFRPLSLNKKLLEYEKRKKIRKMGHTDADVEQDLLDKDTDNMMQKYSARGLTRLQDKEKTASTLELNAMVKASARRPSLFKRKINKFKLVLKGTESSKKDKQKFLDLSLFRNFGFTCLCFQLLLFTLSFNTTFVFLPALAKEKGVPQIMGAYLVSVLGIFDAVARIIMSFILDLKRVKKYRLIIYNLVMFIIGGVSICLPSLTEFWQFAIVAGLYGVLSGTYISQKSVVCVDILGVEKLASSFGLLLLFQGVSAFIGPTLGALLKDRLGSYDMAFYVGSTGIFVGGFVMMAGNIWLYRRKNRQTETNS